MSKANIINIPNITHIICPFGLKLPNKKFQLPFEIKSQHYQYCIFCFEIEVTKVYSSNISSTALFVKTYLAIILQLSIFKCIKSEC
jgi:hypothetical protein